MKPSKTSTLLLLLILALSSLLYSAHMNKKDQSIDLRNSLQPTLNKQAGNIEKGSFFIEPSTGEKITWR